MNKFTFVAVVGAFALGLTSCSAGTSPEDDSKGTLLEQAIASCKEQLPKMFRESQISPPWVLDSDGMGLFIDGQNGGGEGLPLEGTLCILQSLEISESILARMDNTNALMGQQEAEWGSIKALWTFHPSRGLDITLNQVNLETKG